MNHLYIVSEKRYLKGNLHTENFKVKFGESYYVIELETGGGVRQWSKKHLPKDDLDFCPYMVYRVRRCVSMQEVVVQSGTSRELEMVFKKTGREAVMVPSQALFSKEGLPQTVDDLPQAGKSYLPWENDE